ncbi:MAG: FG-GAP repeat protein [Phycisphaerales bacterium]|nr:MAG: FG-GAP repeat protein [Phycisphaerales bacterium]
MAIASMTGRRRPAFSVWAAGACVLTLWGGTAWGGWEQVHKLTADDAGADDRLGFRVFIDESTIVVGAWGDDDAGTDSGSAYVFDAATGQQLRKLTADDVAEGDYFGTSVAVSGHIIVVGSSRDDDGGNASGSAYVFDAYTGEQVHKLTAADATTTDEFGWSICVDGNLVVVGARYGDGGASGSGSAYVFDAVTGAQLHELIADDSADDDEFGCSVSVSGNTIVVGARFHGDPGAAYVFDATTGEQLRKLTPDDGAVSDDFGCFVSICGNTIVVGARGDDDAGSYSGSAYVFDATTGEQLHKLTADDAEAGDMFGNSVSVSGNTVVVSAIYDDNGTGSAYVFHAVTGEQLQKLTADDGATEDYFGISVSISGDTAVAGAHYAGLGGAAYVFERPFCPADLNGDGGVDIDDLFEILASWGPCG